MGIYFIGPISPPITGPGIKNKLIAKELQIKCNDKVFIINTLGFKNKLKASWKIFFLLFKDEDVLISVSSKGRYLIAPLLYFKRKISSGKHVLLPAGGNLSNEIENLPSIARNIYITVLKNFEKICPETFLLAENLKKVGLKSIEVLPNPREVSIEPRKKIEKSHIHLYFISSIKVSKGIIDCIKAVEILNDEGQNATLHIYGRVNESFRTEFEKYLSISNNVIFYGMLEQSQVTETLARQADILLLPTYYFGEGLPGILVEAAMAGVPIITTNFKGIQAYFTDQKNVLFVEAQNPNDLADKIKRMIDDDELRYKISNNLRETSKKFEVSTITNRILEIINS